MDRGESRGVMLCPGGRGNSGQGRVTKCHDLSRRGSNSGQRRVTRPRVVFRKTW